MTIFYYSKGRVALYAILQAMGIGPGDEIILPAYTCVVVPSAIQYLGATPVYVDIDPDTYTVDPQLIEAKLTLKTKVIVMQHSYGLPAPAEAIVQIARRHNLKVVEDACHAVGSLYHDKEVGQWGDAAFFSGQWSKPFTIGLGGWAQVNDPTLAKKMSEHYSEYEEPSVFKSGMMALQYALFSILNTPFLFWKIRMFYRFLTKMGLVVGSSTPGELEGKMPPGYKSKMATWQKQLLSKKLRTRDKLIAHRKWVATAFQKGLEKKGVPVPPLDPLAQPVWLYFPVLVKDKAKYLDEAKANQREVSDWFVSPLHPNLENWQVFGYHPGSCPVAEKVCQQVVGWPTHAKITQKEIDRFLDSI